MRVHQYRSVRSTPIERGRELGDRWAEGIGNAVTAYRAHFRQCGIQDRTVAAIADASYDALRSWSPRLGDELAGIAAGAGLPVREVSMLNARTEVLAALPKPTDGECSTVVRVGETPAGFQTWDWRAELVSEALVWRYDNAPGRWVKTFTELGMLSKLGVNSMGLAVHFNILGHRSDHAGGGVPVHAIARRILDEASTVEEAFEIARSASVSASTVITVLATGSGTNAASIEISPAGTAAVPPATDGWLVHTNHFLDPELRRGGVLDPSSTSRARYDHLAAVRDGAATGPDLPTVAGRWCGAAGGAAPICVTADRDLPPAEQSTTLLTVRLDPTAGVMEYWPGSPYEAARAGRAYRF